MASVLLFHHAHGLTDGVRAFASELEAAGHAVAVPDLYEGQVFVDLEQGLAYAGQLGFGTVMERGRAAAESLPADLVYAGFSLGVLPAQMLAQTRAGARGALLLHSGPVGAELGGRPELFLYAGDQHLFADSSLPAYDEAAARLLIQRVLSFLSRVS